PSAQTKAEAGTTTAAHWLESSSTADLRRYRHPVVGSSPHLQHPGLSAPGAGRSLRASLVGRGDVVVQCSGYADRNPAWIWIDGGDCNPSWPRHCAFTFGSASALPADYAAPARAKDCGGASLPRLARLRHGVEGRADRTVDVLSVAACEYQRLPNSRHTPPLSHSVNGRDDMANVPLPARAGCTSNHFLRYQDLRNNRSN